MMRLLSMLVLFICLIPVEGKGQSIWKKHQSPITADLHNVFFASDSVGWITTHRTGTILHTKNGGENWFVQARLDSLYLESIYFLNEKVGWVSGQNGLVFKTVDGGKSWKKYKIAAKNSWIYSIYFVNENVGIAVGLQLSKRPFKPVFLKTNNGGSDWFGLEEDIPRAGYGPVTFIDEQTGYVGGEGYLLHTSDGGQTWNIQFADTAATQNCRTIRDITFIGKKVGWAVGHCGLVLKTTDGKNWHPLDTFTENRLRSVAFVTGSKGYIVGDANREPSVLYRTTDGGTTWETVSKEMADLHQIELTNNKIWLVGKRGTILSKLK